jgi:uncharacterized protein (UPF0261 family)
LAAFCDEMRKSVPANVQLVEIDAHINDQAFTDATLRVCDQWLADGIMKR